MKLRTLPFNTALKGKRVLVRVDWNIPLGLSLVPDDSLKLERSMNTIRALEERGAIVIVMTHVGRPSAPDPAWSTKRLLPILKRRYGLTMTFHPELVSNEKQQSELVEALDTAEAGTIHLLENVRFCDGEEKNTKALADAYAELGDLFINDAFASCHRKHASVVGIARALPSYAGPSLIEEVRVLDRLITKPAKPFLAIIGGFKLSTKIPVLKALLSLCSEILIGGAMASALLRARGLDIGESATEEGIEKLAKSIAKEKHLILPMDVMVVEKDRPDSRPRIATLDDIQPDEMIVDVGPCTLEVWGRKILKAKTIAWNGPIGITEKKWSAKGSLALANMIALRAKGQAFGVAGGGDTLPVVFASHTAKWFDHLSTGGGAMLEFIAKKGKLPGLEVLTKASRDH